MKLLLRQTGARGSALIVVMVLLAIMAVLMNCTAQSLFLVKRELNLIEKKQLQRYEKRPASAPPQ